MEEDDMKVPAISSEKDDCRTKSEEKKTKKN